MNQVVLVGKVVKIDKLAGILAVECKRNKEEGTDRIPIKLNDGIFETVSDLVKQGMTIGVKAKITLEHQILRIIAEQITFIDKKE